MNSGPIYGLCPVGRDWYEEIPGQTGQGWVLEPPDAPPGTDATDEVMRNLALKKINAFSGYGHGFYFWNFRTDVDEPEWSYMSALKRGWIPSGNLKEDAITRSCHKEDHGLYKCVARRGQLESNIRNGIDYVISADGSKALSTNGAIINTTVVANMTGEALYELADRAFDEFWQKHRVQGSTCDFGGIAQLLEYNITTTSTSISNDTDMNGSDENGNNYTVDQETDDLIIVVFAMCVVICLGIIGCCTVTRANSDLKRHPKQRERVNAEQRRLINQSSNSDYIEIPVHPATYPQYPAVN
jgi:hypothetical protein